MNTLTSNPIQSLTYTSIASELSNVADQIDQVSTFRSLVAVRFTKEGQGLTPTGKNLLTAVDTELANLSQLAESYSHLLEKKLAEPIEDKLGLGQFKPATA